MNAHSESHHEKALHLAAKVCVAQVVASRYGISGKPVSSKEARPQSWDDRKEGIDVVRAVGGGTIKLRSSAMQTTPRPGWVIVLIGGSEHEGYSWTLYGISRSH